MTYRYGEDGFPGYSVLSAMHLRIFVDLCDEYAIFSVKSERNTSESVCLLLPQLGTVRAKSDISEKLLLQLL